MVLRIIYLICIALTGFSIGAFVSFVISKLREIKDKTDNIPTSKLHWGMGVYMDDIPQNEQNTSRLVSVPLKIYDKSEYSDIIVPRKGEDIGGVYISDNKFYMTGIVEDVFYNTDRDCIIVECKCTEIHKID